MWKTDKLQETSFERLCACCAPSSKETEVQRLLNDEFTAMGIVPTGDAIGNLYARINPDADFNIAIVAHSDEIGIQITEINDNGLLRIRKIGGLRCTSLFGHKLTILSAKGHVRGIVGCDPLQDNGTDNGILAKTSDLWVDIGAENRAEAEAIINIGDFAVFEPELLSLGKHRIASKSFDDRLGSFIMLEAMKLLQKETLEIGITAISSVQEELSMRGIKACRDSFNAAIVLDVDFATDIPTAHTDMGILELGKGVGINLNADSNPVMQQIFTQTAERLGIPYQLTLSRNLSGGTDATKLQMNGNIATLNINLPLRYMHTHYEVCDRRDIETAVNSVVAVIKEINEKKITNFVPWQNL